MAHMIPVTEAAWQTPRWQKELAEAVTDPAELLDLLGLDRALLSASRAASDRFRLKVPRAFISRMRHGDPTDPLLRQVLPLGEELLAVPGFGTNPLAESADDDGVLHKYQGRALVITTGACAVHCRYCFRRHFPYGDTRARKDGWRPVLDRFAADPALTEAILSGGDPLSLSDDRLAQLVDGLSAIPHLRSLRIHTRQPIVLPSRVDARLLGWLGATRLRATVVVHANHAAEIDEEVSGVLMAMRGAGAMVLNQSVLLRGVNDSVTALAQLSERLAEAGVVPYYLHLLDPVAGAAHFDVPEPEALALHSLLLEMLPGYLVPRLVREIPGRKSKTIIGG